MADHAGARPLRLIAMLEAGKGLLALSLAASLLLLGPEPLQHALDALSRALNWHPGPGTRTWIERLLHADTLHTAALLVALYGGLRLLEAWGLWRNRAWASWFGALGAAAYIPFELVALSRHPHWLTAVILAVNILVVWVLARDLWRRRPQGEA